MILSSTDTTIAAVSGLIVAITGLVAAAGVAWHSIRTGRKTKRNTARLDKLEEDGGGNAVSGGDQIGHDDGIRGAAPKSTE